MFDGDNYQQPRGIINSNLGLNGINISNGISYYQPSKMIRGVKGIKPLT